METVLITGAARGIGLELTKQFLDLGYQVFATYRNQPSSGLKDLASNKHLKLYELEVTDEPAIKKLSESLSGQTVDIVINNAGVIGSSADRTSQNRENIATKSWLNTFAINTVSPLMVSNALLPNLKKSANPRLLAVSSQMGSLSLEGSGMYAYRSSKAALNMVMKTLSSDLKNDGIAVLMLHPGWVKTDMGGAYADITAEESARGIVALARNLTIKNTGTFVNWNGTEHDW